MPTKPIRIFHIESPGPLDALDGRAEAPTLCSIMPLMGHKIHSQTIHSREDFTKVCRLLGTIINYPDRASESLLVLHISAHGDCDGTGISLGADDVSWQELTKLLQPFIQVRPSYKGKHIVVLSACNAHKQTMTKAMKPKAGAKDKFVPPKYVFGTEDVYWDDAAVAWTLFYHFLPKVELDNPATVKDLLKKIADVGVQLHYSRWDEQDSKYRRFPKLS